MDYEYLTYEECFNKIFNEMNINKKSINKLNIIVENQKTEIQELKTEIQELKTEIQELKTEIENLKKYNKLKNIVQINKQKEIETKIINNNENIKNEIKSIHENEMQWILGDLNTLFSRVYENHKENKIVEEKNNNEINILKETIQNINQNEIEYIYDNIATLNIEVEENTKLNNKINNELGELKEIKNNLHFSYIISSYNYHISYLKEVVKLEIDLFTKLINNNILPINVTTQKGTCDIIHAIKYVCENVTNKDKLNKYLNDNDIIDNKYNFNLLNYIFINNIKIKDLGNFNSYKKNTNNKYAIQFFQAPGNNCKGSEIKIQDKKISKNNFYKSLYNEKNELIIENNDFLKMVEMKEGIDEMEEMILDCLERYEFMKTLKTNTIYTN